MKLCVATPMSQAKVWIPKMTPKEFEEIMMAKFYNREQSKEYVKEAEEDSRFKILLIHSKTPFGSMPAYELGCL